MAKKLKKKGKKGKGKVTVGRPDGTVEEREDSLQRVEGEHLASVQYSLGSTTNLGDYNSCKIEVGVELPCLPKKKSIAKAFAQAEAYCEERLTAALEELGE